MAELLLHKKGRNPGDQRDWNPGEIVVLQDDGWPWTTAERDPNGIFTLVKLPGVKRASLEKYMVPSVGFFNPEEPAEETFFRKRRYRFDQKAFSGSAADAIKTKLEGENERISEREKEAELEKFMLDQEKSDAPLRDIREVVDKNTELKV